MRTNKRRTRARDPLLTEIEQELCLGRLIRYGDMFDFVAGLEQVEKKLASQQVWLRCRTVRAR